MKDEATSQVIKSCRCCKEVKPIEDFIKSKAFSSGYDTICLLCNREKVRLYRSLGKRNTKKEYHSYVKRHREELNKSRQLWRHNNKDKVAVINARHKVKRYNRPILWDTELTDFVTQEAHLLRKLRNRVTKIEWHVDHIVPVCGKFVCGLHVWNNLQVIPALINKRKSNQHE